MNDNSIRRAVRWLTLLVLIVACAEDLEHDRHPADAGRSETSYSYPDPALNQLQKYFLPVLEANKKEFQGQTGLVKGFGAGARYPQIWLRDSATLMPLTRYYYPRPYQTSWLEEHLSHQENSGALHDWIAAGEVAHFSTWAPKAREVFRAESVVITVDKNTAESDQEASAVHAAAAVFDLLGDRTWLDKKILNRSVLARLDDALAYVLGVRTHRELGLVMNAFTADWGDVSPVYADQRAIYLDEATPRVVGLYTNAHVFSAALELGRLHRAIGNQDRAEHWEEQAERIRAAAVKLLWQPDAGFFTIHHVVSREDKVDAYDDSNTFALGGNALAVLYGLASDEQAARIFAVAEDRRRRYGISTVASSLLPPYPTDFFLHPVLRDEYTYQNGGQWDWFAGRFVLAEFERGNSETAREHLLQIARRVERNGGLYEWYSREGEGRGSEHYAGSAGALGAAVYQGLFGIDFNADEVDLNVRLGSHEGSVRVEEPATGRFVSYDFEPKNSGLQMEYRSNARVNRIRILLPERVHAAEATLDGEPLEFEIVDHGIDRYAECVPRRSTGRIEIAITATEEVNAKAQSRDGTAAKERK
jgi:hypothetical protein